MKILFKKRLSTFLLVSAIATVSANETDATGSSKAPVGQKEWIERFSKPISRRDMVDFWAMLLHGYNKVLSEDKCWGDALPEMRRSHWIKAPKNRKGDAELVTRMLWGLGGWFSQPDRPSTLSYKGEFIDVKSLMLDAVKNGTNQSHAGYWKHEYAGKNIHGNQLCVEAPPIGLAYQLATPEIKKAFNAADRANLMEWLIPATKGHRSSNWNMFHALAATIRKINGEDVDLKHLRKNITSCWNWYYDEGVFSDGPARHFDDYNFWVFGTHLMLWYELDKEFIPEIAKELPERMRRLTSHQPWYFGADGSHPEFGRSITYKFTRLASLIQAYRLGMTDVPVGQIRRIVRLHLGHYLGNGAIDAERGLLLQSLAQNGSLEMREGYNFPGSTYWAMQTMGEIWKLADNDPFWTTPEEFLPVENGDFMHVLNSPGWVLSGTKRSGSVNLINVGTTGSAYYGVKYTKQVYAGQLGFCVGYSNPCDHMATLYLNGKSVPPGVGKYHIEPKNPHIMRQTQPYPKGVKGLELSHIIYVDGETIVRVTRITTPSSLPTATEIAQGGYAIGFTAPEVPTLYRGKDVFSAQTPRYQTIYKNLLPASSQLQMEEDGYKGNRHHTREKSYVLPYASIKLRPNTTQYLATVSYGSKLKVDPETFAENVELKSVDEKGCQLTINGQNYSIDFLN